MIIKSREWWAAMLRAFPDRAEFRAMTGCLPENVDVAEAWVGGADVRYVTDGSPLNTPSFDLDLRCYKFKPPTILVNGIEVPGPMTEWELKAMATGAIVYAVSAAATNGVSMWLAFKEEAINAARRGYLHRTEAAAKAHAEALFGKENVR